MRGAALQGGLRPQMSKLQAAALAAGAAQVIPKRYRKPAGTYFVTSRTWQSRALFLNPRAAELFPVWQRGFSDDRIRETADCAAHLRYINDNPVKRGLVPGAMEYACCSASGRFPMDGVPQRLKPPLDGNLCGTASSRALTCSCECVQDAPFRTSWLSTVDSKDIELTRTDFGGEGQAGGPSLSVRLFRFRLAAVCRRAASSRQFKVRERPVHS